MFIFWDAGPWSLEISCLTNHEQILHLLKFNKNILWTSYLAKLISKIVKKETLLFNKLLENVDPQTSETGSKQKQTVKHLISKNIQW